MNGAQEILRKLKENNVEYIFGIPGEVEFELFEEIRKSDIKFITTRHEQTAAFMAEVYYRLTGKIGVCYSTLGPGMTNLSTGLASAFQERSAVLALSGQLSDNHPEGHMFVNSLVMFAPITKHTERIDSFNEINPLLQYGFDYALNEKPGPVHVAITESALESEGNPIDCAKIDFVSFPGFTKKEIEASTDLIIKSKNPVVIVGNVISRLRLENELETFLSNFSLPVFTTYQGKGSVNCHYKGDMGTLSRHLESVKDYFKDVDLVIAIGYDYFEGIKNLWNKDCKIVHIDSYVPSKQIDGFNPEISLIGDLKSIFCALNAIDCNKLNRKFKSIDLPEDNTGMIEIVKAVRNYLNEDDILVSDVGLHKQYCGVYYPSYKPRTTLFSNGLSSMGFGIPASLASKLVFPEKRVVLVTGDGGFQMNMPDLATAMQYNLPFTIILINDEGLGMIKEKQKKLFGRSSCCDLMNPSFESIIKSYKGNYYSVEPKDLYSLLSNRLDETKLNLIEIKIDYSGSVFIK